jgi:hypothetical protein
VALILAVAVAVVVAFVVVAVVAISQIRSPERVGPAISSSSTPQIRTSVQLNWFVILEKVAPKRHE